MEQILQAAREVFCDKGYDAATVSGIAARIGWSRAPSTSTSTARASCCCACSSTDILDPVDTRNALGVAISAALNTPIRDPRYGVFRM